VLGRLDAAPISDSKWNFVQFQRILVSETISLIRSRSSR
jgi:hypothetical protein